MSPTKSSTTASPQVKAAVIDTAKHRAIISKYATTRALHDAYRVTFEQAGFVVKVFSFHQVTGLKNLEIDMAVYRKNREEQLHIANAKVAELLGGSSKNVPAYLTYIGILETKTRLLQIAMDELRSEVMKHNQDEGDLAAAWGRIYSFIKAGADAGVATIGFFAPGAGSAISAGYGAITEGIAVVNDPQSADVFAFKGTGTELAFIAAERASDGVLTKLGERVLLKGPNLAISMIFAGVELHENLEKFK